MGSGYDNQALDDYSFVGAGDGNEANGKYSFVGSGLDNTLVGSGSFIVAGGSIVNETPGNVISASDSFLGAGDQNSVAANGIVPLDDASVLAKIDALPVSSWSYRSERGVRHAGPMAQDFYAAFGVGEDDRHISSIDEDGFSFAAIKALHRENANLRAKFQRSEMENGRMKASLAALERRVDALATRVAPSADAKRSR